MSPIGILDLLAVQRHTAPSLRSVPQLAGDPARVITIAIAAVKQLLFKSNFMRRMRSAALLSKRSIFKHNERWKFGETLSMSLCAKAAEKQGPSR
jgi:hypothetical protein